VTAGPSLRSPADTFLDALSQADDAAAIRVATDLLDSGVPAQEVLLDLVAPAQESVGRLWQEAHWSVAQEHAATAISERVVAAVDERTLSSGSRGHVVLGCLDGEWHVLPARIVAAVMRLHGWRVTFLGASVPAPALVSYLHEHGPDVVALSCALPIHLPEAHRTITSAQRTGTPVLAGGPGFGSDGRWARRLGVDAWAGSAVDAVAQLDTLPWAGPDPDPDPVVAGGAEYGGLRSRRGELVTLVGEQLYDDPGTTSPDLEDAAGHVVDFLGAAVYLGDADVFHGYLQWLGSVLSPRWGARPDGLASALSMLHERLHDFPFTQNCLTTGRLRLVSTGGAR
jgi:methanogenic corrinoid protein MtbC1